MTRRNGRAVPWRAAFLPRILGAPTIALRPSGRHAGAGVPARWRCMALALAAAATTGCTTTTARSAGAAAATAHSETSPRGDRLRSGTVTILHTNDMHGHLQEFRVARGNASAQTGDSGRPYQEYERAGVVGGFPRLATAVQEIRRRRGPENVLLVDAGDTFGDQLLSNLEQGAPAMRLLEALGYQFMALGNHDFEYGAERTRQLQRLVGFPMRGANVVERATGEPFLGDPTTVIEAGGLRVGLLALAYHNTPETGNRQNTAELEFTSGIEAARRWVPALRARSDVVVVVSHQGTAVDSLLAERVPGIDLIVGGHSHDRIEPPRRVAGAWMVQALSDASALGEVTVTVRDGRVVRVDGRVHALFADRYAPDPRFAALLDSLRAPHRARLEEVIATAVADIGRRYKSESPADRLAGDMLREHASAEIALLPGLGFGTTLWRGPITREMLHALFPHPSAVVTVSMTGAQVLETLEQSATNLRPADAMDRVGGLLQTSGLRWTLDLRRPVGQRVSDVSVGGLPLDRARTYRVVTNAGMLQGTHRYAAVSRGRDIERDRRSVTDVLEDAFRRRGTVRAPAMGDVTLITADGERAR